MFGWLKKLLGKPPGYWDLIDPYWETVSIYDGADVFLRGFSDMPVKAGNLFAAHWLQSEVNNGGFDQFCLNSTGVLAPEARDGFLAIGMPKVAALVDEYMLFWGDVYPRDRKEREELWDKVSKERYGVDSNGDPLGGDFSALDDRFYELIDSENGGFELAANAYADAGK